MKHLHSYLKLTTVALGVLVFSACKDDPKPTPEPTSASRILMGAEGLEIGGTGTMNFYDPMQKVMERNIFQKTNTYTMGNILQSFLVDGDLTYLVLNGSAEIIVVKSDDFTFVRKIKGFGAPRQIMKVADNKFYVTDWQIEGIHVLNPSNGNIKKTLWTGLGPESMVLKDNIAIVANGGDGLIDSNLTFINTDVDTVIDFIRAGNNPNSMQLTEDNQLWVLCSGIADQNPSASIPGELVSFNLDMDSIEYEIDSVNKVNALTFSDNLMRPKQLKMGPDGQYLYFLDNVQDANLMRYDTAMSFAPTSPYIAGSFYGLGVDLSRHEIYLSDDKDRIENGEVLRYDKDGGQIDVQTVGIIPSSFGFK